ncbi:arf-GAP with dual PH domain-containing protein 1 isoform X2 [Enhydra lutris kenyoni]|uniref:Arf-GAP with dual PH domain-containing protein 1 isoform X2 n=1 Tax=Enhydra lutris kenyoni TaxID=391180 RepID=A0A2Y9JEJ2_ENHLU|nr:arf-GAP with dual PH domain-containing protein 1 isoform X2 [Enhydra lutris kenyoni]
MAKERRRAVLELLQRPGNTRCADCGAPDPDWASYTLGVFICLSCSGIHRNIPQVSKVKSVRLDAWEEAQVEFMASHGNDAARDKYESKVPPFYYRPTFSDCQLLREQWIRAKYERQEFTHPDKQEPYSAGYREGFLWKRGRDNGQFLSRKFVLTEREGSLKYFNRNDAKEPKAIMKIEHLNATFQPAKIGHPHGLQVTYLKDNSTRNIFVYHEDGKEIVDWFNALRAARFHYLQVAFPGASDADLVPKLSRNYLKEGYMEKTGPKVGLTGWPEPLGDQGLSYPGLGWPWRVRVPATAPGKDFEHITLMWMALDPTTFCKRGPCGPRTVGLWVGPSLPRAFAPFHRSLEGQTRPLPCHVEVYTW